MSCLEHLGHLLGAQIKLAFIQHSKCAAKNSETVYTKETIVLSEFKRVDPIKYGEYAISHRLNGKEEIWPSLQKLIENWSLFLNKPKMGQNQSMCAPNVKTGLDQPSLTRQLRDARVEILTLWKMIYEQSDMYPEPSHKSVCMVLTYGSP